MALTWNGQNFGTFVGSQFLTDSNLNLFYYDQNYQGFFPAGINSDNTVGYTGSDFQPQFKPAGTIFTTNPSLSNPGNLIIINNIIHNGRLNIFVSNFNQKFVDGYTQNPGSYVGYTVSALSSGGNTTVLGALQEVAPYVISPQINYFLNDILTAWPGGAAVIQSISGAVTSYQNLITSSVGGIQSINDFKTKLLRIESETANETRQIQGQLEQNVSQNTFTYVASALPHVNVLNTTLNNANATLQRSLINYLPTGLSNNTFIQSLLSSIFGNSTVPTIVNPSDKLIADINQLESIGTSFLTGIISSGFSSLMQQLSVVNQIVAVANNVQSNVNVTNTIPIPDATTNPSQIFTSVQAEAEMTIFGGVATGLSPQQIVAQQIMNILKTAIPPALIPTIPTDPFGGGNTNNLPIFGNILNANADPTITSPEITLSTDSEVQDNQINTQSSQNQANQQGVYQQAPQGSGINILEDVPLRPRCIPINNGSLGDYQTDLAIAF